MKPFCEVIVADALPALRALITKELMQIHGLNQTEVSKKLGITQPAVSQYRRELRGHKLRLLLDNEEIMGLIKKLSHEIALSDMPAIGIHEKLCEICRKMREEGVICRLHASRYPSIGPCKICFKVE